MNYLLKNNTYTLIITAAKQEDLNSSKNTNKINIGWCFTIPI